MAICPVCNGMEQIHATCTCNGKLVDFGRIMDYEGKYLAYEEIDLLKQNNNIANDLSNQLCPHYLTCPECDHLYIYLIKEVSK